MNTENKSQTIFIGHRGASFDAPENTMAAINLAWRSGADAVEIDIQLTKDRVVVVFHDDDTERFTGVHRPVADYTLEELQQIDVGSFMGQQWVHERIPTFQKVIESVPEGKFLVIELKSGEDVIPGLKGLLDSRPDILQQIVFISFNREAIRKMKSIYPDNTALRVYEPEPGKSKGQWFPEPDQMLKETLEDCLDGLDISVCPAIDRHFISAIHKQKLKLAVWTINDPAQAQVFFDLGIYGITTDRPVWLKNQMRIRGNTGL